jgi:hypothetical protein
VNQAAEQESYRQVGQYVDGIILEYYEVLDYRLFISGILKPWVVISRHKVTYMPSW